MEYDNWGGLVVDDRKNISREELAWRDWWGCDQIAWFANQPEEGRNHFLEYTYKWTEINNPNAYFELPFRRMIHNAEEDPESDGSSGKFRRTCFCISENLL